MAPRKNPIDITAQVCTVAEVVATPKVRVWKTFNLNRNRMDADLTRLSAEGYTVFAIAASHDVMGSYDVFCFTEK